jgi:hypothetical protein
MSRPHWRSERRIKAALTLAPGTDATTVEDSNDDQQRMIISRQHNYARSQTTRGAQRNSPVSAGASAGTIVRSYDEDDEELEEDESDNPGAYAITRRPRRLVSEYSDPYGSQILAAGEEEEEASELQTEEEQDGDDDDAMLATCDISPLKKNTNSWIVYIIMFVAIIVGLVIMTALLVTLSDTNNDLATGDSEPEPVANATAEELQLQCNLIKEPALEDPFLQCACFNSIELKDKVVRETYDRLLSSGPIASYLEGSSLQKESCKPDNIAVAWIAAEITSLEQNGNNVSPQDSLLRFAMCALYAALEGREWTKQSFWLSDRIVCDWYGVGCNEDGKVISIVLPTNDLKGTLGSSIGLLYDLRILDLSNNAIEGYIPSSLWRLPRLGKCLLPCIIL